MLGAFSALDLSVSWLPIYVHPELETGYLREERRIRLHRALGKLHPDYRQVLYLTYFEGFSHAQARAVMKKSKTQMENLMYRAKKALKAELLKEGFDDEDL